MKTPPLRLLLILLTLPVVTASAQLIGYTDRTQVNLLNAYNATLGLSGTNGGSYITPDEARFYSHNNAGMPIVRTTTSNPAATLDFGAVRNVKTISTVNVTNFGFTAATVETSNDGTNWTTYSGGVTVTPTTANAGTNVVTLNSSVDARYVRVTPTAFENGAGGNDFRWYFYTMRAFGDTGTLAGDTNLTILANGGLSVAQSLTAIGSISLLNAAQIIDPATNPHADTTVIYGIGTGEGFQIDLGQTFAVDRATMELDQLTATLTDPIVMTLSGSTDGTNFSVFDTYTWTSDVAFGFFDLNFTAGNARYLNLTFSSNLDSDIRVSDFAFFQTNPVPEPNTVALLALGGGLALVLRRRTRQLTA